jgi:transcriptional/translational regulatory protein YebC/TACO1
VWAFTKTTDGYVPQNAIELNEVDGEALANLIEALEELEDVQDIYTTADGE